MEPGRDFAGTGGCRRSIGHGYSVIYGLRMQSRKEPGTDRALAPLVRSSAEALRSARYAKNVVSLLGDLPLEQLFPSLNQTLERPRQKKRQDFLHDAQFEVISKYLSI